MKNLLIYVIITLVVLGLTIFFIGCEQSDNQSILTSSTEMQKELQKSNDEMPLTEPINPKGFDQVMSCPDYCSGYSPYSLLGYKWSNMSPVFRFSSSLPADWRTPCEYAASTWNAVRTRFQFWVNRTTVNFNDRQDNCNVICRRALPRGTLGQAQLWWVNSKLVECDIVFNSNERITRNAGAGWYDVQSIATHEFGHFGGLKHVNDATHTMYPFIYTDCWRTRTLCAGDILGWRIMYQ